jgi:drug/metabolite transporter (DMT)-like permease
MLSFAAAGAAAVCYGVASVLQAVGARRTTERQLGKLLVRVTQQLPYLGGLALDLAGFVLSVIALQSLPLFLVQSLIAGSVGVTAITATLVLKARLRRPEILALVVLVVGLVLLAIGAKPGHGHALPQSAQWLLLATLPGLAAVARAAAQRTSRASTVTLAAVAGAGFAAVGIAARGLGEPRPWWHALSAPGAWAIIGFGALGVITFAAALQRGSVTVAAAVMSGTETLVPSVVGLVALGDATRSGFGAPVAAVGFALTLGAVFLLAPYSDLEAPS